MLQAQLIRDATGEALPGTVSPFIHILITALGFGSILAFLHAGYIIWKFIQ